jgi:hypothetical protein
MANYTKATNFTAKDGLPTGNSGKIVKGAEIDTELTAIASAISSKADINSPALTGTPTAPTASAATNTTQVATTAFVRGEITALNLGNMSTQAKTAVDITGGTITGITDLAVADGGTGSSSLTANAVLLGNGTSALQTVAPGTSGNVLKSNGTTWTSAALGIGGLGLDGETWQVVTGSRGFGTTYTNSLSKPIMVAVSYTAVSGSTVSVLVAGTTIKTTGAHASTEKDTFSFIVPAGATYRVNQTGSDTLDIWAELK